MSDKERIQKAEEEYKNGELIPCDEKIKDKFFKDCDKDYSGCDNYNKGKCRIPEFRGNYKLTNRKCIDVDSCYYKQLQAKTDECEESYREFFLKDRELIALKRELFNVKASEKDLKQENTALKQQLEEKSQQFAFECAVVTEKQGLIDTLSPILKEILNLNPKNEVNDYLMISKTYNDPACFYFVDGNFLVEQAEGWEDFCRYLDDFEVKEETAFKFLNEYDEDFKFIKIFSAKTTLDKLKGER